jgi:hypothetical protein
MKTGRRVSIPLAARVALAMLACGGVLAACSTNVDLGGTAGTNDGGPPVSDSGMPDVSAPQDAGTPGAQCAPCVRSSDCASGVCAKFADYLFCTDACSTAVPCATDQTCSTLGSPTGAVVNGCLPNETKCAPNNGPVGPDGAPLEHCGNDLDGPGVTSTCEACGTDADDCQPNGCYGGYWCDSDKKECVTPPTTCQ